MPVQIAMPNQQKQEDPLDKIAKAVQIARDIYGIKISGDKLEVMREQSKNEAARREKEDEKTDLELQKLRQDAELDNPESPLMIAIRETANKRGLTLPNGTTPRQAKTMFDSHLNPEKQRDPLAEELARARLDEIKNRQTQPKKDAKEFSNRYKNIQTQIGELNAMIDDKGTYEMTGGHNESLQQKLDSIAIDAAKLFDPQSVARESEVAAFRRMLFEGGSLTTKNSTAKELLANFGKIIDSRAENEGYGDLLGFAKGGGQDKNSNMADLQRQAAEELERRKKKAMNK